MTQSFLDFIFFKSKGNSQANGFASEGCDSNTQHKKTLFHLYFKGVVNFLGH